jgi:hypothetical protein
LKNLRLVIILTLLVVFVSSCGDENGCEAEKTNVINPNGDSELAILMREMVKHAQDSKDSISINAELPEYPEKFSGIFFAKKIDPNIDKQMFDGLAQVYLNNLKFFQKSEPINRRSSYNNLIRSCEGCHQNFCSGPLKRINKLYIKEK